MLRYSLIYGGFAGAIVIGIIIAGLILAGEEGAASGSQTFGYLIMLAALTLIFVAVKRYRDRVQGGVLGFWPGFGLGLGVAAVAGVVYVIGWEFYLAVSGVDFIGEYAAGVIERKRAAGASAAELDKLAADMAAMKESYANPLLRLPMTFAEIFPVGVLVALVSAAVLRNPKSARAHA